MKRRSRQHDKKRNDSALGERKPLDILPGLKAGDSYGAQARH